MNRRFELVDVFGDGPLTGNPLAVVFDGDDLDSEQMQQIARWINLSETTFLCSPTRTGADYRVRIFTPVRELPFAGHPTLGTCHAWLTAGGGVQGSGEVIQECGRRAHPHSPYRCRTGVCRAAPDPLRSRR